MFIGVLSYQSILPLPQEFPDKIIYSEAAGGAAIDVYCRKHNETYVLCE